MLSRGGQPCGKCVSYKAKCGHLESRVVVVRGGEANVWFPRRF